MSEPDDAQRLNALHKLEASVLTLLARGEVTAWEVGIKFDQIARHTLHTAAGFATLEAYANKKFTQGYATLKRYRRVATSFRKATVKLHGTTKLNLLLEYIGLTPEQERMSEVLHLGIRVPRSKKVVAIVPFPKASVTDLTKAIVLAKSKPTAHDDVSQVRAKRARAELQAAVAAPKGTRRHAPLVRAHVTDDKTLRYDVVGIDHDDLERVGRAMISLAAKKTAPKTRSSRSA